MDTNTMRGRHAGMRLAVIAALCVAALAMTACGGESDDGAATGGAGKQTPIRIGYVLADNYPLYVAHNEKLFEHAGLKPKLIGFASGAPLLAALKSGSIDAVHTGLAVVFAIGQNIPIKVLGWTVDNAPGEGFVVDPKTGVTDLSQIGKLDKVAMMPGTCTNVGLVQAAKKGGVELNSLNVIKVPPPVVEASLRNGSIQGGVVWGPYSQKLEAAGYKVIARDPAYGGVCPTMIAARPDFLKKHPEAGQQLIEAQALALEAVEKSPQLAIDALQRRLKLTPEVAKADFEDLSGKNYPTFTEQLDPASPRSIVSKDGLARQLAVASQAFAQTKVIAKALTAEQLQKYIVPSYMQKHVDANPGS
jgi:NitT/TauT family transport system substrate-binding protein